VTIYLDRLHHGAYIEGMKNMTIVENVERELLAPTKTSPSECREVAESIRVWSK
jgi:hypothetical protein